MEWQLLFILLIVSGDGKETHGGDAGEYLTLDWCCLNGAPFFLKIFCIDV
jgi:hypothetical protein